ncbi:GNAT family N-acetyltransferase [Ensifer sp. Root127]|uniref:GNAT family N-acetyltransferase n=1 Tax=Ensifer sp. Root127 TaxID=1736440 RepID=UPI0007C8DD4F|nr:GNAT family N-acetyltransferase [Ensifer sp. Root127]
MFKSDFDPQPALSGEAIFLRPLRPEDLEGLYSAASHPDVWAGHPATDRYKREKFEPYFALLLASETTLVAIDRQNDKIIGCSRYYVAPDMPDSISIGFTFLNKAYWGGGTNFDLKRLMLGHAFGTYPEVWFHIAPTNIRSQKATAKLGAAHVYDAILDLLGTPSPWMCFRLRQDDWNRVVAGRAEVA